MHEVVLGGAKIAPGRGVAVVAQMDVIPPEPLQ